MLMSTPDVPASADALKTILAVVNAGWWTRVDFWIGSILGVGGAIISAFGLYYAVHAFREAKRAAEAAHAAARSVKIQTVTMELQEVAQKLSGLPADIRFVAARVLLTEANHRVRRHTAPFKDDPRFKESITQLRAGLSAAWNALDGVRPTDPSKEVPYAVFNAIDNSISQLTMLIADLLGLMETESLALGEDDVEPAAGG